MKMKREVSEIHQIRPAEKKEDFIPKKKVATPAHKKALELAKKKPEIKKSTDNKENEPPKQVPNKRTQKELEKESKSKSPTPADRVTRNKAVAPPP
jgi:hypothetical protein